MSVYFAVAAYDSGGLLSGYSNEAVKTFTLELAAAPHAPVLQSVDITMTCVTDDPQVTCKFTVQ